MKLILVRHGETNYNRNELVQGRKNVRLSDKGKKQSKLLAKRLKKEKIDAIYSSDLYRCKHATKEILKELDYKGPVHYTKELREGAYGIFEGKKVHVMKKYREKSGLPHHMFKPRGGESRAETQKRAVKFFNKIKKGHKNDTVLFVTHGGIIKSMLFYLMKKSLTEWGNYKIHNTSVSEIKVGKNNRIKFINCTKHLRTVNINVKNTGICNKK